MSKAEELQRILQYVPGFFAKHPDVSDVCCLQQDFEVTDADVQAELRKLGATKAMHQPGVEPCPAYSLLRS